MCAASALALVVATGCRSRLDPPFAEFPAAVSMFADVNDVRIDFDRAPGAVAHQIYLAPDPSVSPENFQDLGGDVILVDAADLTTIVESGLLSFTQYWAVVVAEYAGGVYSPPSPAVSSQTLGTAREPPYPLDSASFKLSAEVNNVAFGYSLANLGDVDHDGREEVGVSDPDYGSFNGRVYVTGLSDAGEVEQTTLDGNGGIGLGMAMTSVGFLNAADEYADIAVSAPRVSGGDGAVYIFLGSPQGPQATPFETLSGAAGGEFLGAALAAGDFLDTDGVHDLLASGPTADGADMDEGTFLGFTNCVQGASFSTTLGGPGTQAGAVAIVDYPDPGVPDDFLVGAPLWNGAGGNEAGLLELYRGGTSPASDTNAFHAEGSAAGNHVGQAGTVASGDIDRDDLPDIVVGVPGASPTFPQEGAVYVFKGFAEQGVVKWPNTPDQTFTGAQVDMQFGTSVVMGRVNRDNLDDVVVGSPSYDGVAGTDAGRIDFYAGHGSGTLTRVWSVEGTSAGMQLGAALALADLDGNGTQGILASAPGSGGAQSVFFFAGPPASGPHVRLRPVSGHVGDQITPDVAEFSSSSPGSLTCYVDYGVGSGGIALPDCTQSLLDNHQYIYGQRGGYVMSVRLADEYGLLAEAYARVLIE